MSTTIVPPSIDDQRLPINQIVTEGDSLSDQGVLYGKAKSLCRTVFNKAPLHGLLPSLALEKLIGFDASPNKRFTNGDTWADDLAENITDGNFVEIPTKDLLTGSTKDAYNDGCIFLRGYAEGGATAANYRTFSHVFMFVKKALGDLFHLHFKEFKADMENAFSSVLVTRLEKERKTFLKDDKDNPDKAKTLIIEWTGANDFLTVNDDLISKECDSKALENEINKAIDARLKNAEELIKAGYKNIILIGLPDFAITPRFQRQSKAIQDRASKIVDEFNTKLKFECDQLQLQDKYGDSINLNFFDINPKLKDVYNNPEQYGFDSSKKNKPFIESEAFQYEKDNNFGFADGSTDSNISNKYMFWDDIHPTDYVHQLFCEAIYQYIISTYRFEHVDATNQETPVDALSIVDSQNNINTHTNPFSPDRTAQPLANTVPKPNGDEYPAANTPALEK
jgi:phospholipase/lecithinase/hemolysin